MKFISVSTIVRNSGGESVIDLLREYDSIKIIGKEFPSNIGVQFRPFDGFYDLFRQHKQGIGLTDREFQKIKDKALLSGYSNQYSKQNLAIRITNKIARAIIKKNVIPLKKQAGIKGYGKMFPNYEEATNQFFEEVRAINYKFINGQQVYDYDDKIANAINSYLAVLFASRNLDKNDKVPVLKHLIRPRTPPISNLLPEGKIIIVLRDPRDQFCDIMTEGSANRFVNSKKPAETFVRELKSKIYEAEQFFNESHNNVIKIQFEDLIYQYHYTKRKIEEFLGLSSSHSSQLKYFQPEVSMANTQLFKNYENLEELKLIETELFDYLYPFSRN